MTYPNTRDPYRAPERQPRYDVALFTLSVFAGAFLIAWAVFQIIHRDQTPNACADRGLRGAECIALAQEGW